MLAGASEVAFSDVDFAERNVGIGERRLLLQRNQQVAFRVVAPMLHAQKLRELVMTFRPIGILLERALLFRDLARGFLVEHGIGDAPEEVFCHPATLPQSASRVNCYRSAGSSSCATSTDASRSRLGAK